eukprot:COSAG06_NODE_4650_length_4067_cov_2.554688_3_plen_173_part_00
MFSLCLSRACLGKLPFYPNAFEKDQKRSENGAQKNAFSFEQQWKKTHTVDLSRAGALRPAIWRLAAAYLHKTPSFLVLSLCLSRACLGKVIIIRIQSGTKTVFLYHVMIRHHNRVVLPRRVRRLCRGADLATSVVALVDKTAAVFLAMAAMDGTVSSFSTFRVCLSRACLGK